MTLSNAAEIVFLAATVLVLLRVNHDRNGRTDGRTAGRTATMAIGGKQPSVAFPLKIKSNFFCLFVVYTGVAVTTVGYAM